MGLWQAIEKNTEELRGGLTFKQEWAYGGLAAILVFGGLALLNAFFGH